jgi:hypothetical protein
MSPPAGSTTSAQPRGQRARERPVAAVADTTSQAGIVRA